MVITNKINISHGFGGYCVTHNVDNTVTSTKTEEDECEIDAPTK